MSVKKVRLLHKVPVMPTKNRMTPAVKTLATNEKGRALRGLFFARMVRGVSIPRWWVKVQVVGAYLN
jgi:hypothetical protein